MKIFYLFFILFFITDSVYSQWSKDPNENLQVAVHGGNIHAVPDGKGGAIITFNNFDYDVVTTYLQAVDRYGYLKWTEPKIIADGPGPKNYGAGLFSSDDDNYIVGYKSGYNYIDSNLIQYSFYDPYIQKIDTNGNKLWGEYGIKLNPNSPSQQVNMFMCNDGNGGIYAFWKISPPPDYSGYDSLFIQHISKNGERLWGENGIFVDDSIFSSLNSWLIDDDSGGIYIHYRKEDTLYHIMKFDVFGNLNWTLKINVTYFPIAIKDGYGGIIISGVDVAYPANKVIINRISSEGEKLWGAGIIVDDSVGNSLPSLIFLNKDSTTSVFWDNRWWPNDDVFLQRYTLEGEQVWEERLKVSYYDSSKTRLGIIGSDNISNIIVWAEYRDPVGNYVQKVDATGKKLWNEDKFIGAGTSSFHVITDGNSGAIAMWQKDPPWGGIYAQQISKNGNLGEVITSVREEDNTKPESFYLSQNFPNPFNPSTQIIYRLPVTSFVTLKVYDILGNEVKTLINEEKAAGEYKVEFNASNLPAGRQGLSSGIYFYKLTSASFTDTKKLILLK